MGRNIKFKKHSNIHNKHLRNVVIKTWNVKENRMNNKCNQIKQEIYTE